MLQDIEDGSRNSEQHFNEFATGYEGAASDGIKHIPGLTVNQEENSHVGAHSLI